LAARDPVSVLQAGNVPRAAPRHLRASAEGNVKMMYPMISGLDEWNQATVLRRTMQPIAC